MHKRTLVTPRKVYEEVSNKETRNHFEPRDVRVSLPRRAEESSEVRSSGDNVPTSASLDAETDEGRPVRLNAREESYENLVNDTWPKRLRGHNQKGGGWDRPGALEAATFMNPTGVQTPTVPDTFFFIDNWVSPMLPTLVVSRP